MDDKRLIGCDAVPEPAIDSFSHLVARRLEKLRARPPVSVVKGQVAVDVIFHLAGTRRIIICCNTCHGRFFVFTLRPRVGVSGSAYARIQKYINSPPKVDEHMCTQKILAENFRTTESSSFVLGSDGGGIGECGGTETRISKYGTRISKQTTDSHKAFRGVQPLPTDSEIYTDSQSRSIGSHYSSEEEGR